MLENIALGLGILIFLAGAASLVIAKMIMNKFLKPKEISQDALEIGFELDATPQEIRSTRLGDFATVPRAGLMIHRAGAVHRLEARTHYH